MQLIMNVKVSENQILEIAKQYVNATAAERKELLKDAGIHRTTLTRAMIRYGIEFRRVLIA
jgi:DNA-binding NtrC family response regulator